MSNSDTLTLSVYSPTQDLLSLATFIPLGQTQVPPSRELLQEYSHPRLEHRFLAEISQVVFNSGRKFSVQLKTRAT